MTRIILALLMMGLGLLVIVLYNGTPHSSIGQSCSPIHFFNFYGSASVSCKDLSRGEIIGAIACFVLAVLTVVTARPGRRT